MNASPDVDRLRAVIDELANALQVTILQSARLDQLTTEAIHEASGLRKAISRCVVAVQSLQPGREQ